MKLGHFYDKPGNPFGHHRPRALGHGRGRNPIHLGHGRLGGPRHMGGPGGHHGSVFAHSPGGHPGPGLPPGGHHGPKFHGFF